MNNGTFLKNMGNNIRAIRKSKNITQKQLAEMSKINANHLCEIEGGRRSPLLLTLKSIADSLEIDIKMLL